jgi:hypothetical protein
MKQPRSAAEAAAAAEGRRIGSAGGGTKRVKKGSIYAKKQPLFRGRGKGGQQQQQQEEEGEGRDSSETVLLFAELYPPSYCRYVVAACSTLYTSGTLVVH